MTTKIEWATETWNPVTGCTPISEGCEHCYAKRMATRLKGRFGYPEEEPFQITLHADKLSAPSKWKKPRMIFVCSMSDLFHDAVTASEINIVLHHAELAPQHTYLFLTKRPQRMLKIITTHWRSENYDIRFKNWWFGVTAENQQRADERIPYLIRIPAAIRFVSVEPMLSKINLSGYLTKPRWGRPDENHMRPFEIVPRNDLINWVIVGGETGPGARLINPDWVRSIRDQCINAHIPFFFKQWGPQQKGRMLDGKIWNEFPLTTHHC